MDNEPRKWYFESGQGRLDKNGIEWFTCDPYPTWYRWEDGELISRGQKEKWPGWADE